MAIIPNNLQNVPNHNIIMHSILLQYALAICHNNIITLLCVIIIFKEESRQKPTPIINSNLGMISNAFTTINNTFSV